MPYKYYKYSKCETNLLFKLAIVILENYPEQFDCPDCTIADTNINSWESE